MVWGISSYASLDGTGGLTTAGRWHSKRRPVDYCTLHPATALHENPLDMEIDSEDRAERFQVLKQHPFDLRLFEVAWRS